MAKIWNTKDIQGILSIFFNYRYTSKGIDINRISDKHFMTVTGSAAKKLKGSKYLKFWMKDSNTVAFITISNTMIDRWGNYKKSQRIESSIIGDKSSINGYLTNESFLDSIKTVHILDLESKNLPIKADTTVDRFVAKRGATALMSDKDIKNLNLKRYTDALKEKGFMDGSEAAVAGNIHKVLATAFNVPGASYYLVKKTFLEQYIEAYASSLLNIFKVAQESGFDFKKLESNANTADRFAGTDYTAIKTSMKNSLEKVKNELKISDPDGLQKAINLLATGKGGDFLNYIISNVPEQKDNLYAIVNHLQIIEKLGTAINKSSIGQEISSISVFASQFESIRKVYASDYDSRNSIDLIIELYAIWLKEGKSAKPFTESLHDMFDRRFDRSNVAALNSRLEKMIKIISMI